MTRSTAKARPNPSEPSPDAPLSAYATLSIRGNGARKSKPQPRSHPPRARGSSSPPAPADTTADSSSPAKPAGDAASTTARALIGRLGRGTSRASSPAKRSHAEMEVGSDSAAEGEIEDVNMVPAGESPAESGGGGAEDDAERPANKKVTRVAADARDAREVSVDMTDEGTAAVGVQGAYRTPQSGVSSAQSTTTPAASTSSSNNTASANIALDDIMQHSAPATEDMAREEPPPIDQQIAVITQMSQQAQTDGMRGFVVNNAWLEDAQSRGTNAVRSSKETRAEGPLPAIDNRELVDQRFSDLQDERGEPFYPLKLGFEIGREIEILPEEAWRQIMRWHGAVVGSPDIIRFCHNTSDNEFTENLQFELYPPLLTVLKLPDTSGGLSKEALQANTAAPVKIVSSRNQPFADFLARAKEAAKTPEETHVRVWRVTASLKDALTQAGMPTPAASRSHSPAPGAFEPIDPGNKLVIDMSVFLGLQEGSQRELIDLPATPAGAKEPTVGFVGLENEGVIVLEERIMGPAGGEWVSDGAKATALKNGLQPKGLLAAGKKSAANSGRTSPALGMTTRGRAQKSGKKQGTVGLANLGNSCYMNSALQCVRSVEELTLYFLGE